jgi:meiotically up-regulated gene 157 (Mug157) protein
MSVELLKTAEILRTAGKTSLAQDVEKWGKTIGDGVWEHGVVKHKRYGEVFAFEVDGYGSHIIMDDANVPSLLALPVLGFVEQSNPVYQNTRKMILEKNGNPFYLLGKAFKGIGGLFNGIAVHVFMSLITHRSAYRAATFVAYEPLTPSNDDR